MNKKLLLYGAIGLGLYYLLKKKSTVQASTPVIPKTTNGNELPSFYDRYGKMPTGLEYNLNVDRGPVKPTPQIDWSQIIPTVDPNRKIDWERIISTADLTTRDVNPTMVMDYAEPNFPPPPKIVTRDFINPSFDDSGYYSPFNQ